MEEQQLQTDIVLKLEVLFGDFSRRISNDMEALHEHMDRMELSQVPSKRQRDKNNFGESEGSIDEGSKQRSRLRWREINREDDHIKGIKMKIPWFRGRFDPEAYLKWERKVEMIFEYHNYPKE